MPIEAYVEVETAAERRLKKLQNVLRAYGIDDVAEVDLALVAVIQRFYQLKGVFGPAMSEFTKLHADRNALIAKAHRELVAEVEAAVHDGVFEVVENEERAISKGSPAYSGLFRATTTINAVNRRLAAISGKEES